MLQPLSELEPTMTLEEGLRRGLQECQHTNNFDQMIFYEMAEKCIRGLGLGLSAREHGLHSWL